MTLTINGQRVDLPPTLAVRLAEVAAARGEGQTHFAVAALRAGVAALAADMEAQEDSILDSEAVAGLGEGLAQLDAGQGRPFSEFVAEVRAARQTA